MCAKLIRKDIFEKPPLSVLYTKLTESDPFPADYVSVPEYPIDPCGDWENTYLICEFIFQITGWRTVKRSKIDAERFSLEVKSQVIHSHCVHETIARLVCLCDALGKPESWKIVSRLLTKAGEVMPQTNVEETGKIDDGQAVTIINGRERKHTFPNRFTSDYSLFEAVQRIKQEELPLEFDLYEEMDLLKKGQLLDFQGKTKLKLRKQALKVYEYQQVGSGILPFHYLVDQLGCLIVASTGTRLFIHNPSAKELVNQLKDARWQK